MKIYAKLYKFDTPNANGITYTTQSLHDAVKEYNKIEHFAVARSKAPVRITVDLRDSSNMIGPAKLSIEGDYVIATVDTFPSGKGKKAEQVIETCTKLRIMPICLVSDASPIIDKDNVEMTSIAHIICTCEDVDIGDVETDMFEAKLVI